MSITPESIKTKIKHKFNYYRKKFDISNVTLAHSYILDGNFRIFYDKLLDTNYDEFAQALISSTDPDKKFRIKLESPFSKKDKDITVKYFLSKFHHTNIILCQ